MCALQNKDACHFTSLSVLASILTWHQFLYLVHQLVVLSNSDFSNFNVSFFHISATSVLEYTGLYTCLGGLRMFQKQTEGDMKQVMGCAVFVGL